MSPLPAPGSPSRHGHIREQSLSEAVLAPQAIFQDVPGSSSNVDSVRDDEISVNLAEHHEALMGTEFRNPANIKKQPTIAT